MSIDEKEREQTILDAAAQLLLRHGYNKTTMSDVADAVDLNRALIYLHFKSITEPMRGCAAERSFFELLACS